MCEVHKTQDELAWKNINKSLEVLSSGDFDSVVINVENKTRLSGNDFLDKMNESIESFGYEIQRVYNEDSKNPNFYGLSVEKADKTFSAVLSLVKAPVSKIYGGQKNA